jgi:Gram-negative bacterial TonB protein C-terminal
MGQQRINQMRNELLIPGLFGVVLLAICAPGQAVPSAAGPAVPILQGAALPVYPPIAKAARVTGKVIVKVTVKNGMVVQTNVLSRPDVASRQQFLDAPTVENLKTWRFAADVSGTFTVIYTYEISGKESDDLTNSKVEMLPSLDVKITARPARPTVMYEKYSRPSTR